LERRIGRAETLDAARVVRVLEPMVTDERRAKLKGVLERRIASVAVVFDSPYDPHNGAAVIRTCEAFGVQTLHVVERGRITFLAASSVTRGAQKWLDVIRHRDDPSPAIAWAEERGMELVATHPEGELTPADLHTIPRLALVLGNEREGIHEDLARACTRRVRVPMRGFVESLNVSVTAAILLHAATEGRPGDLDDATALRLYARGLYFSVPQADKILAAISA
jgi:tRNA (guanosine-2'-O-)-methyltransferase